MESYAGVRTTGIYCRPGCGAQPRSDHVLGFDLAASAESAGYRACLRCRPYRTPLAPVIAGPEIVCRAVRLILDGALDERTEAPLAARLGMSSRHLRRLFVETVGVTPHGLARSARTHFGRRLLDDTDLRIADIAFAAGFGSVRQFNRSTVAIFKMTPSELRARRRRTDRLVADGGLSLRLPFRGPLDWDAMVLLLARHATPGVEHIAGSTYRRTITVGGHPGVVELTSSGQDQLLLRLHLPHWSTLMHLVGRARRLACLDLPLPVASAHLAADQVIAPLLTRRPGLRPPGSWSPYETAVRAVLGQQTAPETARALAAGIVQRYGEPVAGLTQFGLTHTFPRPRVLAASVLEDVGLDRSQVGAIGALSRAVRAGGLRLDRSIPLDELLAGLTGIDGIEESTAQYIALRLGEADACPDADATRFGLDPAVESSRVNAGRWSPWRALATTHLWFESERQRGAAA